MSKTILVTATLFATLGCGGSAAPGADAPQVVASGVAATETPATEALATETPAAEAAVSETAATQPAKPTATSAPRGKRAPCVLGQDQTCNGDTSVSALWGKCTESGTCECKPGFELAPTGYCQPTR